jgi:hypothetical protein
LTPTAQQSEPDAQVIEERGPVDVGSVCALQVAPPSVVDTSAPFVKAASLPTAQQSDIEVHVTPVSVPMPLGRLWGAQ